MIALAPVSVSPTGNWNQDVPIKREVAAKCAVFVACTVRLCDAFSVVRLTSEITSALELVTVISAAEVRTEASAAEIEILRPITLALFSQTPTDLPSAPTTDTSAEP